MADKITTNTEKIVPKDKRKETTTQAKAESFAHKEYEKLKEETLDFERHIVNLPANRLILFFVGLVVLVCSFPVFGRYGLFMNFLIGVGIMFTGFTGRNLVLEIIEKFSPNFFKDTKDTSSSSQPKA